MKKFWLVPVAVVLCIIGAYLAFFGTGGKMEYVGIINAECPGLWSKGWCFTHP